MRADVAFSAGLIDDARAATDEAKALDPAWPAVAAMEGRLAAAVILPELMLRAGPVEVGVNPTSAEKSGHRYLLTVALAFASVALVAGVALGWRAWAHPMNLAQGALRGDVTLAADPVVDAELETALPAPTTPRPAAPAPAETVAVSTSGTAEPVGGKVPPVRDAGVNIPSEAANRLALSSETTVNTRPSAPSVIPPFPLNDEAMRSPQSDPVPVASLKPPAVEAAPVSAALPSPASIPVSAPEPSIPVRTLAPETIAAVDARSAVRAVLARYEAAYSGLNVSAARAVWPAVDQRALARAFDGLSSQRVALDRCDVTVSGTTAHAACSGSAEWTPKVGGGQRRQNRQWAFDLANASGTWQIVRAETK
jgi:hypothetical protein